VVRCAQIAGRGTPPEAFLRKREPSAPKTRKLARKGCCQRPYSMNAISLKKK
jgi:hypothetical protein